MISRGPFRERLFERLRSARSSAAIETALFADRQTDQLARYFDLLRQWNRKMNLTALPLDPLEDRTIDRLFVEPLKAAGSPSA